jgi:hypothetical protein
MADRPMSGRRLNVGDATWVEYFVDASGAWLMYHFPGNDDPSNRVPEQLDDRAFTSDERSVVLVENQLRERFGRVIRREHGPAAIVATWDLYSNR